MDYYSRNHEPTRLSSFLELFGPVWTVNYDHFLFSTYSFIKSFEINIFFKITPINNWILIVEFLAVRACLVQFHNGSELILD